MLRFFLCFVALTALYYVVVLLPWVDSTAFPAYLRINARISAAVLNGFGQACHVDNTTIRSPHFAITVRRGCDALEPAWLFAAAVLAFPAPWRRRFAGLLAGTAVILALNLVRIVSLYLLGAHAPALFESAHLEIWPVCFIAIALALWLLWVRRIPASRHASA